MRSNFSKEFAENSVIQNEGGRKDIENAISLANTEDSMIF